MLWKEGEVCPALGFRKEPKIKTIIWKCDYFDADLAGNLTPFGIKKYCMEHQTAEIVDLK